MLNRARAHEFRERRARIDGELVAGLIDHHEHSLAVLGLQNQLHSACWAQEHLSRLERASEAVEHEQTMTDASAAWPVGLHWPGEDEDDHPLGAGRLSTCQAAAEGVVGRSLADS